MRDHEDHSLNDRPLNIKEEYQLSTLKDDQETILNIIRTTKDLKDCYESLDNSEDVLESTQRVLDTTDKIINRHNLGHNKRTMPYNYGNSPVTISRDEYQEYLQLLAYERQRRIAALNKPVLLDNRKVRYGHNYSASLNKNYYSERNYRKAQLKKYQPRCSSCSSDLLNTVSNMAVCHQSWSIKDQAKDFKVISDEYNKVATQKNSTAVKTSDQAKKNNEIIWQPRSLSDLRHNRVIANASSLEQRLEQNYELDDFLNSLDEVDLTTSERP